MKIRDRQSLVARSDVPAARPSQHADVAERQRQSAAADVEEMYLKIEADLRWRIRVSSRRENDHVTAEAA